jgi:DNA-binding NtrC family response regulator
MARVLLVDESEAVRQALQRVLESVGHTVLHASDGRAALASLKRDEVQLALVDLGVPAIDDNPLIERIRERFPDTKLIAMGHTPRSTAAVARQNGILAAIRKPFGANDVLDAVSIGLRDEAGSEESLKQDHRGQRDTDQ